MENKRFNWIFSKEELQNTPSRKCGIDAEKELAYRQQAASMIQDMGQRLQVNQLCINTALVYMHRFYMFHSFTKFHRNMMGPACIFLAAKVEEQPRKLEHVLKERHRCLCRDGPIFDNKSDAYLEQAQELVVCENILLQTLGFDITVDHPHTHVVKTCQLVRASKDFAQTSYFLATNSLHLTTMCLQYPPTVVACVCIHLASKWADYQINTSKEGKEWYWYINKTVTMELLEELANDFLTIVDKCPEKLKKSIMAKVTKRGISEKEEEQPAKKRVRTEASATISSSASTSSEGKAAHSTKISDELDLHSLLSMKALDMQRVDISPIRHGVALAQSGMTQGNMLPVTVEPTHMQAVTFPSPVNEPIMMPLPVENVKQEKVAPLPSAPEKLSLRDYRQRNEQRPPPLALLPVNATDKQDVAKTSQHVMLKEAKVLVHDMQHSQGHDKLIFTTAQHAYDASRKRQNSGSHSDSEKRRHHHHYHHHHPSLHGGQEVNQRDETEHRHTRVEENTVVGGRELEGKSSLKVHIKRESSGAHHIHHSSSSPLKLKIKRDPETATMHAASDGGKAERDREKKESLKLRLPINSTGRGDSDKHSRSKGHDVSSAQTPQKLTILMGSGTGNASSSGGVVVSSTLNSNGHSDRKRSKHSRSHSQVVDQSLHHASSTRSLDSSLRQSSSSTLISAPPPPPPEPLPPSTSSMNLPYISAISSTYHPVSHHPPLQTQFSGFSLNDSFLEHLPENIFDTDNPSNVGDMNGLAYDAPQTPTAENFKQIMVQHKSRHHPRHNSFHIPPHPLMYPVDNCYPQNPPLPPPLPPEPNPPPPPPPPPSH